MAREIVEQTEFGSGGGNGLAAHGESHGGGVDLNFTHLQRTGQKRALETPQHRLDPGHKFARTEGFGDVVIRAEFQTQDAIRFAAPGGEKDDRDRGQAKSLPNGAAEFQPIPAGDHDISYTPYRPLTFTLASYP